MNDFELFWQDLNSEFTHYIKATEKEMPEKLQLLMKYGKTGKFEEGLDVDLLDDLSCTVLTGEIVADIRGLDKKPLIQLKDALTLFFARLKLEIERGVELPPLLEACFPLIDLMTGVQEDYLTIYELSLLWEMHPNTIRNEVLNTTKIRSELEKKERLVLVPVGLALTLSMERRGFTATEEPEREGMILVPVTSNNEFFNYQCRNRKGFRIGLKGSEFIIDDVTTALSELRLMSPKAYWRRKNTSGNWTIVSAMRWELRTTEEVLGTES